MTDSQELAVIEPQAPLALFGTNDPVQVIETAARVATALAEVVNKRGLFAIINKRKFPTVEAWTLLGSMLGVFPVTEWTRPVLDAEGNVRGYEARVVARTLGGRIVGAGEAMCVRGESATWGPRAIDNALRSMAQTRATSKALRGPLDFVFKLAGFQPTPAEEMVSDEGRAPAVDTDGVIANPSADSLTAAQQGAESAGSDKGAALPSSGPTPTAAANTTAPSVNQGRSVGPRAKRGNVVPAPQGVTATAVPAQLVGEPAQPPPVARPPLQEAVADTLADIRAKIDKRAGKENAKAVGKTDPLMTALDAQQDAGHQAYLASLRTQAQEAAATLHMLNVRRKNRTATKPLPEPPDEPNPGSEAALSQYIASQQSELGLNANTLDQLDQESLIIVIKALEAFVERLGKQS
jgi:hypothetical protein